VFVLSSDYEGFGIVLVEALACGVPVVSTDAPHGPRFVLGSQGPSVLVPCGSPEQLAEGIIEVLDRGPVELSTRCLLRERAARFSLEDVAGRFEELLDQVLDDARGP
jgi:glycosyltransferase involved in cell wall biosynthesis